MGKWTTDDGRFGARACGRLLAPFLSLSPSLAIKVSPLLYLPFSKLRRQPQPFFVPFQSLSCPFPLFQQDPSSFFCRWQFHPLYLVCYSAVDLRADAQNKSRCDDSLRAGRALRGYLNSSRLTKAVTSVLLSLDLSRPVVCRPFVRSVGVCLPCSCFLGAMGAFFKTFAALLQTRSTSYCRTFVFSNCRTFYSFVLARMGTPSTGPI